MCVRACHDAKELHRRRLRGTHAPVLVEFVVHALLPGLHNDLLLEVLHGGSLGYDGLHHELAELKGQVRKKVGLKWGVNMVENSQFAQKSACPPDRNLEYFAHI